MSRVTNDNKDIAIDLLMLLPNISKEVCLRLVNDAITKDAAFVNEDSSAVLIAVTNGGAGNSVLYYSSDVRRVNTGYAFRLLVSELKEAARSNLRLRQKFYWEFDKEATQARIMERLGFERNAQLSNNTSYYEIDCTRGGA